MTENHFVASQKGLILSYYVLYRSYVQYDILTDFVSGMVFVNTEK